MARICLAQSPIGVSRFRSSPSGKIQFGTMTDPSSNLETDKGPEQAHRIAGTLNYLRWIEADETMQKLGFTLNAESALNWFCQTLHRPLMSALVGRYAQVANLDHALFFFPTEHPVLVEKVLIPLHQAKVAFVLGHEFGCIAMCGMV